MLSTIFPDHHKSWQIFQIFLQSTAKELLIPYVQECSSQCVPPSVPGYYKWLDSVQNPNYKFMCEVVFTYCLALHVFRAGVRRNNSEAIIASRAKFAPLFYGLNMPFYMETFVRDSFLRMQCPPDILAFIEQHESYSASGCDSKGEGGDFILEAKNRATKRILPPGLPDEKSWLQVCRNLDKFEKVYIF